MMLFVVVALALAVFVLIVDLRIERRRNWRLEERNAAQAQTIAGMRRVLDGTADEEERRARFELECG